LHRACVGLGLVLACATGREPPPAPMTPPPAMVPLAAVGDFEAVFAGPEGFVGSELEEVGRSGLFPTQPRDANRVAILDNGDASFAARIQALQEARQSIRIQALIFTGDESGLLIAELLKQRHAEGLDVRVIVDAFSNPSLQTQWMYFDLKQNGVEVEGYEALALQWLNEVPTPGLQPHAQADQLNRRFHEKMWIVDGETDHGLAIVGGLNIANEYFRVTPEDPPRYWRDQDVVLRGAVVRDVTDAFDRNYAYFKEIKASRGIANTDASWEKTRAVLARTGKVPMFHKTDEELAERVSDMAARPLSLHYADARARFFQNRPRLRETYIEQAYLKAIRAARGEVLVSNAYFVASPEFRAAVGAAARRCVRVLILTNGLETNDLPAITIVGRTYYAEMLSVNTEPELTQCRARDPQAGIEIWEWQGRRAHETAQREGTNHGKWAVFDRRLALVGSHNLDPRSENLNSESAVVFESEPLAQDLARTFYEGDLPMARRIPLEEAQGFEASDDVFYKLQEEFGQIFEEHL